MRKFSVFDEDVEPEKVKVVAGFYIDIDRLP
jgi:hypothetical protein